jgi:hypothetical protein
VNARLQFGEFLMTCGPVGVDSFSILFAVMLRGLRLRYASLPETQLKTAVDEGEPECHPDFLLR